MLVLCVDSSWSNSTHSSGLTPLAPCSVSRQWTHFNMQTHTHTHISSKWLVGTGARLARGTKAASPPVTSRPKKKWLLPSSRTPDKRAHRQTHTLTHPVQNKPLAAAVARRWGASRPDAGMIWGNCRWGVSKCVCERRIFGRLLQSRNHPPSLWPAPALCCVNLTSARRRNWAISLLIHSRRRQIRSARRMSAKNRLHNFCIRFSYLMVYS